jgi:hypothetical protein
MAMWPRFLTAVFFLLSAECAYAGTVVISINQQIQEMTVTVDGQRQYVWPVSTGMARYATPGGSYTPFRMEEFHFSQEWGDAPMPHSIFFTGAGHAIHGTEHVDKLGKRASHGCVRLDPAHAATLFALVQEVGMPNTSVIVTGKSGYGTENTASVSEKLSKKSNSVPVVVVRPRTKSRNVVILGEAEVEPDMVDEDEVAVDVSKEKQQLWPYERRD